MEAHVSLMELLEGLHDPRRAQGKRHPLPALLGLAVVAMLAGMTSYEAIVQYGKERGWDFLQHLGFTTRWGLCKATYSRVFRRIDVADFEARVGRWIRGRLGPGDAPHIAIDGKTARGSRDGDTPGVHLVSAYAPDVKAVLAQLRVDAKTNEHKAALELLGVLPLKGKVVTGDAMFTHRDVCADGDRRRRRLRPAGEGQPTDARPGHRGRLRRARGRPFPPSRPRGARPRSSGPVRSTRGTAGSRSGRSRSRRRWRSTWARTGPAARRSSA